MSLTVAVIVVACLVVGGRWLLRAIVLDEKSCWACKGTGRNPWSTSELRGKCWFCRGEPWRPRRSARMVRSIFRSSRWGK